MATTGTDIYESALVLMDANNDADTSEYESKALAIINVLRGELYPYSDNYNEAVKTAEGMRPICPILTDLDGDVGLDDYICQSVMPYGLAGHLLLDENPSTANFLMQRYYELLAGLKRGEGKPVFGSEDIEDAYSNNGKSHFYYNRFTTWGGD